MSRQLVLYRLDERRFGYAISGRFESGVPFVMNLNSLDAADWKISERLALSGEGCWLEVEDMIHLRYHPRSYPLSGFTIGGRSQAIEWKPEWTEVMGTKAEGMFGYRGELEGFARSCLGEGRPRSDLWDGAKDLQVSEAVWHSAISGEVVRITQNCL